MPKVYNGKVRISTYEKFIRAVQHPQTKEEAYIILDTKTLLFYCRIDNQRGFSSKEASAVVTWAEERLRERAKLTWFAIIRVEVDGEKDYDHSFSQRHSSNGKDTLAAGAGVTFQRLYVAKSVDGWRYIAWQEYTDNDPIAMIQASEPIHDLPHSFDGTLPYVDRGHVSANYAHQDRSSPKYETRAVLAYDEATWNMLIVMRDTLVKARARLTEIIGDPPTLAAFAASKQLALTVGVAE